MMRVCVKTIPLLSLAWIVFLSPMSHAQVEVVTPEEWHNLFNNDQIRHELEITSAQRRELNQRLESIEKNVELAAPVDPIKHYFLMQRLKSLQEPNELEQAQLAEDRQRTQNRNDRYGAEINAAAQGILVPFQIERLHQLTCWQIINERGYAAFLEFFLIRKTLDPNRQKAEEIDELARKLHVEFERDLEELRAQYREKLNQALTAEQARKVKEIIGEQPKNLETEKPRF